MRINVKPEIPGAEDMEFQLLWSQALIQAEGILSETIENRLEEYIQNIDQNIIIKINKSLDILLDRVSNENDEEPIQTIRAILNEANIERNQTRNT